MKNPESNAHFACRPDEPYVPSSEEEIMGSDEDNYVDEDNDFNVCGAD